MYTVMKKIILFFCFLFTGYIADAQETNDTLEVKKVKTLEVINEKLNELEKQRGLEPLTTSKYGKIVESNDSVEITRVRSLDLIMERLDRLEQAQGIKAPPPPPKPSSTVKTMGASNVETNEPSNKPVVEPAVQPAVQPAIQPAIQSAVEPTKDEVDARGYTVKVGDNFPDFEITLDDGSIMKKQDFEGKVVMLQFTASWCGVCRKEMPLIEEEIWSKLKERDDFVLLGVDRDEPLEKVLEFKGQTGVTYPLALDPGADIFGLFASKRSGVTRNVIVDQNGKIVFLTRLFERGEFDEMKEKIFELLK